MVETLKKKLRRFLSTSPFTFYSGYLFYIAVFLVATFGFLAGLPSAWSLLTKGSMDSYAGIWTLMVATFFGGLLYKQFSSEKEDWQSKSVITPAEHQVAAFIWDSVDVVEHKDKEIPGWVGVGVFVLVLMVNAHFEFSWYYLKPALETAFMAWGAFALVVQAPWSASLGCDAERQSTKKSSYSYYVLEVKKNQSGEWERLLTAGEIADLEGALEQIKSLRESGKYSDMRLIEESGMRQVRMTFN